ncbi:hypothetical protein H3N56_11630 [Cetobacterium sp. 2A]|uniref:hypothetical protein n=1 Tax=Cetobacterium sp. 2A TaxID=2754723 RepID=UPI00163C5AB7|nr:hypothetical protein [Cetobacterium sp. 2A]MBC2857083.1 hypothetical protein [Cetobacterium sp. 2A]
MKKKRGFKFILFGTIIFIFFKNYLNYEKNPPEIWGDTIRWKSNTYIISQGGHKEGKRIAKGDGFSLFSAEDPTETFIVYRSFLDNALYVKEDFKIPVEGKITKISWKYEIFTDKYLCDTILKILESLKNLEINTYESEDPIFRLKPGLVMRPLYVAYENTGIPTIYKGEIGIIKGKWAITTSIEEKIDENRILYKTNYVLIPENYIDVLKDYFKAAVQYE